MLTNPYESAEVFWPWFRKAGFGLQGDDRIAVLRTAWEKGIIESHEVLTWLGFDIRNRDWAHGGFSDFA